MDLCKLPCDILRNILSYVEYPETPSCKALKEEVFLYNCNNHWIYTRKPGYYHIHYMMSFSEYYFDKMKELY